MRVIRPAALLHRAVTGTDPHHPGNPIDLANGEPGHQKRIVNAV
jgi:hypothetical protein